MISLTSNHVPYTSQHQNDTLYYFLLEGKGKIGRTELQLKNSEVKE